ncbi:hypothetical protein TVAG_324740 [Trichomonas vaginalis G3]|uniref:Uncharacterized protein n=1 Tax=Trichomonas vaginalis (strain ATCC PRA-98 / G3) TaxID=412133 RepID=A2G023_TRIV3|nr:hypothetical protein TVAGG3_0081400 [Trichomonas vaginalis G3]EAX89495.1 hypothetical protein TVAG_324740 [Trichomonas vaginalis G3]KAI5543272.1 hypothetical protein TVAGG3_0081400 [Trichomonas vaginalis G3]|eukprot:XP_001302425.1 hypothetical protein [Trichomonas vaginalis G3]
MNTRLRGSPIVQTATPKDTPKANKKDFFLMYSKYDPIPFDWNHLNRNSSQQLIQMCYCLKLQIPSKNPLKNELIDIIKKHLYPPKSTAPIIKPAVGAAAAAAAAQAAANAAQAEKEKEQEEKQRLKIEMSKTLPPFFGRVRLNSVQYPVTEETKKQLRPKVEADNIEENNLLFQPFDKIPSTAIKVQRGGTSMFAEENDDETRVPYSDTSIEKFIIDKIRKILIPKKGSKEASLGKKTYGQIFNFIYIWLNIAIMVFIVFYIMFWY